MSAPSLGVMLLVHKRWHLIRQICHQIKTTWPDAVIDFTSDRPSLEVCYAIHGCLNQHAPYVRAWEAPFPAIDHKENFIALRDWQLQKLHETGCRHVALWDDDHLLADPLEAKAALDGGADLVYATKAYFWDSLREINIGLPRHTSILFSRRVDGDRWTKMVGAPEKASQLPNVQELKGPLLDVGYLTSQERARVWEVYKRAGKIDQLTTGLIQAPTLHSIQAGLSDNEWYRRLELAVNAEACSQQRGRRQV